MDWNALGTWAAVVVALGISLKDTFHRWRDRSARHLLVAATILPQVGQTQNALRETVARAEAFLALPATPMAALRDTCDAFLNIVTHYGLHDLRGTADQADALPEHILVPLAKAMTLMHMLAYNSHAEGGSDRSPTTDGVRAELQEWSTQGRAVLASLDWVERGIQRKLNSRRWTNPEQLEW